jgi:hypothetical protein
MHWCHSPHAVSSRDHLPGAQINQAGGPGIIKSAGALTNVTNCLALKQTQVAVNDICSEPVDIPRGNAEAATDSDWYCCLDLASFLLAMARRDRSHAKIRMVSKKEHGKH